MSHGLENAGGIGATGRIAPGPTTPVDAGCPPDPIGTLGRLIDRYGDVVRFEGIHGPSTMFVHPAHVQEVFSRESFRRGSLLKIVLGEGLLSTDGPRWRRQRQLMQPSFRLKRLEPFIDLMVDETARVARAWDEAATSGAVINVSRAMTLLTLRIIVRALFTEEMCDDRADALCDAITWSGDDLSHVMWTMFGVPYQVTPNRNAEFTAQTRIVDDICRDQIERRRSMRDRPADLLTLLIEARPEGRALTDKALRDEMVTMLLAGHETTAVAMTWSWTLLDKHPEAETRLHEEVDRVLAGPAPTLAELPELRWTRATFHEVLRLYPPVWFAVRISDQDEDVGGYALPRGTPVALPSWFTHRHREFWTDPDRFDPERFLGRDDHPEHRFAYIPFSAGRHVCLGIHFARLELTVALAQLARRFRVHVQPDQVIRPFPGITLRPLPEVRATIERRGDAT